ncbi:FHA domain-containing protein [Clostridium sp. MB05]|uniref:FHA domain-containing protein n=1 Tax=Clostridium sp. MB05 TaxID=3376682 RepID=UPI003982A501
MNNLLKENENFIRKSIDISNIVSGEIEIIKDLGKKLILVNTDVDNIINPKEMIYYISGLERVSKFIVNENGISNKEFLSILIKICKNFRICEQNRNINIKKLYLVEDYIFIDPITQSVRFIYLPSTVDSTGNPIDKVRLVLLKLVDIYISNTYVSPNIVSKVKGELTYKFTDIASLLDKLTALQNSVRDNKVLKSKVNHQIKNSKFNIKLAGIFLIAVAQVIATLLAIALYNMSWDNPNMVLLSIAFVIIIDLFVSFLLLNFLILPMEKDKEVLSNIAIPDLDNYKNIDTSNIHSEKLSIEEFSGSSFLKTNDTLYSNNYEFEGDETTYLETVSVIGGEDEETSLLEVNHEKMILAYLISENNGTTEKITISKEIFIIGRLKQKVDYAIQNGTVGKEHAKIIYKEGVFYITDLNSKNGTYLNGLKLEGGKLYELANEDNITFSNVKYAFKS